MARRKRNTSAIGGNFDSMLDTLMNVVGILVIVLVAVQISGQEAAVRIAAELSKIDPQQVARLEAALAQAKEAAAAAAAALRDQQQEANKDPKAELSRLETALSIEEQLAKAAAAKAAELEKKRAAELAAVQRASEKLEADRKKKAQEQKATEARLADLKRKLGSLPALVAPPAKEVRLPDPRPAPSGVQEVHVMCREGRIWVVDILALREKPIKRADFVVKSKKLDLDGDRWLTDGKTLATEFNKAPVKDGGFEMTLDVQHPPWPRLVLTRMKGRGETADEATRPTGEYARMLRRLAPNTHIIRFFVWPDSFEAYLKARELAGERGYAAGWEPRTNPEEYGIGLGKYSLGVKPPPKPFDPNAKPPPPPPNVID